MDDLSYNHIRPRWNGMLLAEVDAAENGEEFVGRTGFPLSGAGGGTASYSWTAAGLLKTDSARGISNTLYNRLGLPTSVTFADKSRVDFRYGASGELLAVSTYAVVEGSKRPVKVSERSYCGDFVLPRLFAPRLIADRPRFHLADARQNGPTSAKSLDELAIARFEGDSLLSVEFTGGYFDGDGNPHFRHADWQGNVAMVTDGDGFLEQHVGYYPYGEPWREPVGQSRLFGGKERLRDGALNDYDFKARRLNSALGIWSAPDPLARDFAQTNPYVYCAANPIRFIDPTGYEVWVFGDQAKEYVDELQKRFSDLTFSLGKDGKLQATENLAPDQKISKDAKRVLKAIQSSDHILEITSTSSKKITDDLYFVGGAQMGAKYSKDDTGKEVAVSSQTVNPLVLSKLSEAHNKPGQDAYHELTEAYEIASQSLENKSDIKNSFEDNEYYNDAHNRAAPQSGPVFEYWYDHNNKRTDNLNKAMYIRAYTQKWNWRKFKYIRTQIYELNKYYE